MAEWGWNTSKYGLQNGECVYSTGVTMNQLQELWSQKEMELCISHLSVVTKVTPDRQTLWAQWSHHRLNVQQFFSCVKYVFRRWSDASNVCTNGWIISIISCNSRSPCMKMTSIQIKHAMNFYNFQTVSILLVLECL